MLARLEAEHWDVGKLTFQEFRNQSSIGKLGIDRDWGVQAQPNWTRTVGADGQEKLVRNNWLMKNGKPATEYDLQKDGERIYQEIYESVTKQNAKASFQSFTTFSNPESFKDLGVLENLRDPNNLRLLQKIWGDQTGRTIRLKAEHILSDPELNQHISMLSRQQEVCRALAKEIDTKVLPIMEGSATNWAGPSSARIKIPSSKPRS